MYLRIFGEYCLPTLILGQRKKMRKSKGVREKVHYPFGTSLLRSLEYNWGGNSALNDLV